MVHNGPMLTRQIRIAFLMRYANVLAVALCVSGAAIPASRTGFLACTGGALAATALLHGFAARTGRWREAMYVVLGVDIVSIGIVIYLTGLIASPFLILLTLPFTMAYFLDRSRRAVIGFGLFSVGWFIVLFAAWWTGNPEVGGWNARAYPWYAAYVFFLQLLAIAGTAAQAFDLPDPLVGELSRQEAELTQNAHRAELGTSLAMMAHEIRNPLTTVGFGLQAAVDQLKIPEGPRATRALRHLQAADQELARLNRMLEGLLAYARERRGRMRLEAHRPLVLFDRAAEFVRLKWIRSQRPFQVEAEAGTARGVLCDADAMHQVLVHLLDTAVHRADPARAVRVSLGAQDLGDRVALTVTGTGIPPDGLPGPLAWRETDRWNASDFRLSLAKTLVEEQGGTFNAERLPEADTVITISLPAAAVPPAGEAAP